MDGWVLLFGGFGQNQTLSDTWAFDDQTGWWRELRVGPAPPGRFAGGGAFDSADAAFLIVGGLGASGLLNDTWLLDRPGGSSLLGSPALGWAPLTVVAVGATALVILGWRRRR